MRSGRGVSCRGGRPGPRQHPNGAGLSLIRLLNLRWRSRSTHWSALVPRPPNSPWWGNRRRTISSGSLAGSWINCASRAAWPGHALLIDCGALGVTPVRFPRDRRGGREHESKAGTVRQRLQRAQVRVRNRAGDAWGASGRHPSRSGFCRDRRPTGEPASAARHVITEQARVWSFADALQQGDLVAAGNLMRASHESPARRLRGHGSGAGHDGEAALGGAPASSVRV